LIVTLDFLVTITKRYIRYYHYLFCVWPKEFASVLSISFNQQLDFYGGCTREGFLVSWKWLGQNWLLLIGLCIH